MIITGSYVRVDHDRPPKDADALSEFERHDWETDAEFDPLRIVNQQVGPYHAVSLVTNYILVG